jgi:molybdenum cofactor cytidylyltransferase
MIFAQVPVNDAIGAVLAHSVACLEKRLRKGMILDQGHIGMLLEAGQKTVSVARLETGDINENMAATLLAKALVPDPEASGIKFTTAFTGRVNLIATGPGIVIQDTDKLIEMNTVDPAISCATVSQFQQMAEGGLVATVKIISYAVGWDNLNAACYIARDAIKRQASILKTASLLITQNDGGPGDKGVKAIQSRLTALGVSLESVVTVPHEINPMAAQLGNFKSDLILILTSSATSDIFDTAPAAVRAAGGDVSRFGMPVDPGNLLFLGHLNDCPIIGLPGCVRSPALNGADWVLSRIVCGVACDDDSFAQMSVGGLLKEIPTRPQPRRSRD